MLDNLGPKKFSHASREFWQAVEREAGSRKAIAAALRQAGHQVSDAAVGGWVRGEYEPDLMVTLWCGERWDVSLDKLRLGPALEAKVSDQLEDHGRRLGELEGWLRELASAVGYSLGDMDGQPQGVVDLSMPQLRRELAEVRAEVDRLKGLREQGA